MAAAGIQPKWPLSGGRIAMVSGFGLIVVGTGKVMNPGRGLVTIMGGGSLIQPTAGCGCRMLNGRQRGFTGAMVEII